MKEGRKNERIDDKAITSGCKKDKKTLPDLSNWIKTNTFKTSLLLLPRVSTKVFVFFFPLSFSNPVRATPRVPTESYYFHIYGGSGVWLWSPASLKRPVLLWLVPVNTLKQRGIWRSVDSAMKNKQVLAQKSLRWPLGTQENIWKQ